MTDVPVPRSTDPAISIVVGDFDVFEAQTDFRVNGGFYPTGKTRDVELRIPEDAREIEGAVMHVERNVEFARRIGENRARKVAYAWEPVLSRRNRDAAKDSGEAPVARIFVIAVKGCACFLENARDRTFGEKSERVMGERQR